MNEEALKETFFELVAPDMPNEWDVEDAMQSLATVDEEKCGYALQQVSVIWPVSHSLCFDYLKTVASALECFEPRNLPEWVNSTLDQYEKQGLRAAQKYMEDVEGNFLCPLRGESGVAFKEVQGYLLPYLRGLSGEALDLAPGETVYTDTSTIFVPHNISVFPDNEDNIFLYKLIVSYQWAFIACSSYTVPDPFSLNRKQTQNDSETLWLKDFLDSFSDTRLAADIYHMLETIRVSVFLEQELPGLVRRMKEILIRGEMGSVERVSTQGFLPSLQPVIMGVEYASRGEGLEGNVVQLVLNHKQTAQTAGDSVELTQKLYELISNAGIKYTPEIPPLYQGIMRLDTVQHARNKRLEANRELFVDAFTTRLLKLSHEKTDNVIPEIDSSQSELAKPDQDGAALVIENKVQSSSANADSTIIVTINNEAIELDEELQAIADNIINDLGYLPEQYVASAVGRAGKGYASFTSTEIAQGPELILPVTYDEWDYRRSDFRKNWCSVLEKQIPLTRSSFYPTTLHKYHGQILRLRHQFEMMRTSERFVRRQRDGDDIDLDAVIESISDARAGLAPSDRLFVRLKRDERDIAVLFLIDMSNSTQGWVNEAIKESLVLLCEALEIVGDRYGIYGFSGMRRLRSEFFHIKHLDESYDEVVKQRISSIAPREYTRMGPALRHATTLLRDVDARVRLLVTLSDGKPEDYDDYKGEYAIEDTRHALIEAKVAGIHPFCITIDKHAQDYIGHMYGSVNYIQIDDVKKLPHRMPEIYRVLTN